MLLGLGLGLALVVGGDEGQEDGLPPMHFALVTFSNLGSAEMRGGMIAQALNRLPYTSAEVVRFNGKKGKWSPSWERVPHVCICVKRCDRLVSEVCKELGAVVVWDLIDNRDLYEGGFDKEQQSKKVDGYFVNNREYVRMLETEWLPGVPAQPMPHQHTNVACSTNDASAAPDTVMLLGAPENYPDPAILEIIKYVVRSAGLNMTTEAEARERISSSPEELRACQDRVGDSQGSICKQLLFHRVLEKASIAIIWPKDVYSEFETRLRPVTRLVTAWSHGIPTAFFPYRSYIEASVDALQGQNTGFGPEYMGLVASFHELAAFLRMMTGDEGLRIQLVERIVRESSKYSTVSVAARYPVAICLMFKDRASHWGLHGQMPDDCEKYREDTETVTLHPDFC
jgi:hypothetical protein